MLTKEFAGRLAEQWLQARNSHDVGEITSLYTDDCNIVSPMAKKFLPESNGCLNGKEEITAYWERGLKIIPDLHFSILDILIGLESITIYYFNVMSDKKAAEVMYLNKENKVYKSVFCYSEEVFDFFY